MHNLAKVGAGDTAVQGDMLLPANGLAVRRKHQQTTISEDYI